MKTALYRKYRPQRFEDVVGQNSVAAALKNQVKTGRFGHSYIFTGIRGIGKTSFAKMLAKAVNCPNSVDGEPCCECDICLGIDNGSILDVTEIDAASNSGVDNIRDLRDETAYAPAVCRMRVYIIDEVHMLTKEAFNALLKIMEEPPEHVMFILATTEIHRVPATILSRCQRFELKRISAEDIAGRLKYVAEKENIDLTDDGAALIARLSDGAMRDAFSLLDTCASLGETVDEQAVAQMAGVADKSYLFELCERINDKDVPGVMEDLSKLYEKSLDPTRLVHESIKHFRDLLMLKVTGNENLLSCSEDVIKRYRKQASSWNTEDLLGVLTELGSCADKLNLSADRMLDVELTFIKLCSGVGTVREASAKPAEPQKVKAHKVSASTPSKEELPVSQDKDSERDEGEEPFGQWGEVVEHLKGVNGMLYAFLQNSKAYLVGNRMLISASDIFMKHMRENEDSRKLIKSAIEQVTGKSMGIGPYEDKKREKSAESDDEDRAINALLERTRNSGVKVEIKDSEKEQKI